MSNENLSLEWTKQLHSQVQALELRFQAWDRIVTLEICARKHHGSTTSPTNIPDIYPAWIRGFCNKSSAARIHLHQKFIEGLDTSLMKDVDYAEHRSLSLSIIHKSMKEILDNVSGALNFGLSLLVPSAPRSLGGYISIWPLQVIMRCPYADQAQRIQARECLETIGVECGLSYAIVYARSFEMKGEFPSTFSKTSANEEDELCLQQKHRESKLREHSI